MPDIFTKRKRSEVMARIRGRGNKGTEVALAKLLRVAGITGWRRQQPLRLQSVVHSPESRVKTRQVTGRRSRAIVVPDFIFRRQRVAVFVDGCFWHGCPKHCSPLKWIRKSTMKKEVSRKGAKSQRSGKVYWRAKLAGNRARDRVVNRALRRQGWRVVRLWEHELARERLRGESGGTDSDGVAER